MYAHAMSPAVLSDPTMHGYMRTAVIKGFEYTYALAYNFVERFLEVRQPHLARERPITFNELLRSALDYKLITSLEAWNGYRKKRNITSHGYNASVAEDILSSIPAFIQEVHFLLNAMIQQENER